MEAFSSHDPIVRLVVFHSQMNSALEQLEKSVSEMIALYAGREGIFMYCKINVTIYVYIVDSYKQMLHNGPENIHVNIDNYCELLSSCRSCLV